MNIITLCPLPIKERTNCPYSDCDIECYCKYSIGLFVGYVLCMNEEKVKDQIKELIKEIPK